MRKFATFIITIVFIYTTNAQKEDDNWIFGNGCGVTFNTTDGKPQNIPMIDMVDYNGSSAISDANGELVMYVADFDIWNRNNIVISMANDTVNKSYRLAQENLILASNDAYNSFYIFSIGYVNKTLGLFYSTVDMKLNDGNGGVVQLNNLVNSSANIRLTAIPKQDGNGVWILCFDNAMPHTFHALLFENEKIYPPVISDVANNMMPYIYNGYLKVSKTGNVIASAEKNNLAIYDFNRSTGVVTKKFNLEFQSSADTWFYGVEFSDRNNLLYATYLQSGDIYNQHKIRTGIIQFDLSLGNANDIWNQRINITDSSLKPQVGALLSAPDGRIYVAQDGNGYLGVINNPNKKGLACNFDSLGFKLKGICYADLPNFYHPCVKYKIPLQDTVHNCNGQPVTIGTENDTNFIYRWKPGYGLVDSTSSMTAATTDTNIRYTIYAVNKITGCQYSANVFIQADKYSFAGAIDEQVDIGGLCLNTTTEIVFPIINKAHFTLQIDSIRSTSYNNFQFPNTTAVRIESGKNRNIKFRFGAKQPGTIRDSVLIYISSPCIFTYAIPINGYIDSGKLAVWSANKLASPDAENCLPVYASYKCNELNTTVITYEIKIKISKQLFKPSSITSGQLLGITEENGNYIVDFKDSDIDISGDSTLINNICGNFNIGNIEKAEIVVDTVITNIAYRIEMLNGSITTDICSNGLRQVQLFNPTELKINPNPTSNGIIDISISTEENGRFILEVISSIGTVVWNNEFINAHNSLYTQEFTVPTDGLGNGIYFIRLHSPWQSCIRKVVVKN